MLGACEVLGTLTEFAAVHVVRILSGCLLAFGLSLPTAKGRQSRTSGAFLQLSNSDERVFIHFERTASKRDSKPATHQYDLGLVSRGKPPFNEACTASHDTERALDKRKTY